MPVIVPAMSLRNFTPNSTAPESLASATAGVAVEGQIVSPVTANAVVNDQENGAVITLPDRSVAPLTVAVYAWPGVSAEPGVNVAVFDSSSKVTVLGTMFPPVSFRTKARVVSLIGLLKVALIGVPLVTPVAPGAGVSSLTIGGALGLVVVNDQENGAAMTLPARSVAPLTVAV